eukprot:gene3799-13868_t
MQDAQDPMQHHCSQAELVASSLSGYIVGGNAAALVAAQSQASYVQQAYTGTALATEVQGAIINPSYLPSTGRDAEGSNNDDWVVPVVITLSVIGGLLLLTLLIWGIIVCCQNRKSNKVTYYQFREPGPASESTVLTAAQHEDPAPSLAKSSQACIKPRQANHASSLAKADAQAKANETLALSIARYYTSKLDAHRRVSRDPEHHLALQVGHALALHSAHQDVQQEQQLAESRAKAQ